jgi:hypothetical protein
MAFGGDEETGFQKRSNEANGENKEDVSFKTVLVFFVTFVSFVAPFLESGLSVPSLDYTE